jgi:hypothetical protein
MQTRSKETVLSVANAIALATGVVHELVGKNVSDTINNNAATRTVLASMMASRIHSNFSKHTSRSAK